MQSQFHSLTYLALPACAVDQYGRINCWNSAATEFFGASPEEALGREWHSFIRTENIAGCCALCEARRALRAGRVIPPLEVMMRVHGVARRAVVVPLPASATPEDSIGFLMLNPEMVGGTANSPETLTTVVRPRATRTERPVRPVNQLTARERDILACIVEGYDARRIAAELGISHATARNYVQRLLFKLGAHNKAEAVTVALTHDLLAS